MEKDQIKLAFSKVKQDIYILKNEISSLKSQIENINNSLCEIKASLNEIKSENTPKISQNTVPAYQHINPTFNRYPTDTSAHQQEVKGLKSPNLAISTGNGGVPTDRQTDRQTDNRQTTDRQMQRQLNIESDIKQVSEILNSLDRLKKEIRLKFKQLTNQEMIIFSTIYQLEEKDSKNLTYKQIALSLNLTESSIRDYVQRIIKKGIPIKKEKLNNKQILLSISPELKKIATLNTIIQLREL